MFWAAILAVLIGCSGLSAIGAPLVFPSPSSGAVLYGDAFSYSIPILAYRYYLLTGIGVTSNSNPYYIDSTPGAIKDMVVIATGSNGGPLNANFSGMDDSFETPNGTHGSPTFYTSPTNEPGTSIGTAPVGDQAGTWDTDLTALLTFLDNPGAAPRNDLLFFFNNNQTRSDNSADENLYGWGQIAIRDSNGNLPTLYFDFTNANGGIPGNLGADPTAYTSTGAGPVDADYVLSGGHVCVMPDLSAIVPCGTPGAISFEHNLGADHVAYALWFPEVNAGLEGWLAQGYDTMSVDLRLRDLNNGYEQLFIMPGMVETDHVVPEPATLVLVGAGFVALAIAGRKKFRL